MHLLNRGGTRAILIADTDGLRNEPYLLGGNAEVFQAQPHPYPFEKFIDLVATTLRCNLVGFLFECRVENAPYLREFVYCGCQAVSSELRVQSRKGLSVRYVWAMPADRVRQTVRQDCSGLGDREAA
jgi:hypothetical protein